MMGAEQRRAQQTLSYPGFIGSLLTRCGMCFRAAGFGLEQLSRSHHCNSKRELSLFGAGSSIIIAIINIIRRSRLAAACQGTLALQQQPWLQQQP
jgi:hypothetical protein